MKDSAVDFWDVLLHDIAAQPEFDKSKWIALFQHSQSATSARPSKTWLKNAKQLINDIGSPIVAEALLRWLTVIASRKSGAAGDGSLSDTQAISLRGLLWLTPLISAHVDVTHELSGIAQWTYKKIPGVGPRSAKVGNAAIYALSQIQTERAVGQLAILKVRIKLASAQKQIEKAFSAAAEGLGLDSGEIEEIGVPTYGLQPGGSMQQILGDHIGTIVAAGSEAKLVWSDSQGRQLKSVPSKVRNEFKEEFKDLKLILKDIQSMLPAQRDRIDSMFLQQKSWNYAKWRERYLDHPLVGTIASRLIWCIDGTSVLFREGKPITVDGDILSPSNDSAVTMWHPVGRDVAEIMAWRNRLEQWQVKQPFKQAHREVYLLTDAERRTVIYSNRFAAHVLRQHQFHALCAARGWKNKLRLMVDDFFPPATKHLPEWNLRAEFWIDGIGDEWSTDTNDAGVYLRVATDQVRFYLAEAAENYSYAGGGMYESAALGEGETVSEPLLLVEMPQLVFSEIMRDVDLFVGVASVGNDPNWADGGPDGRFRDYWQSYSFGELSGTAKTRLEVLEKLIPRLKIAPRCAFEDRFLVVRGDIRTYKIHLGSGNILMKPNDQYLCIVPDSRKQTKNDLFLPFEGDNMLSVIISKALLLAEDREIKDRTITSQIHLR